MAVVIRVDPAYNGKIAVQSNNALNGTVLSNALSQETLLSIYTNQPELRGFLTTEYSTAGGSYYPATIDPALLHAYESAEITHNAGRTDYPANTIGKVVNDNKASFDALAGGFSRPLSKPLLNLDFANGRFIDPRFKVQRNSVGTYIDRNGYVKTASANMPRFTFDPMTGESLGLLMEESRTNLLTYSTDFSNASWVKSAVAIANMDVITPNGTLLEGSMITDNSNGNEASLNKNVTITDATAHTFSVFAKAGTVGTSFKLQVTGGGGNFVNAIFNLGLGTKNAGTAYGTGFVVVNTKISPYANGWFKCEITFTSSSIFALTACLIPVSEIHTAGASQYMYVYGSQLSKGSESSSYIPTGATSVTREQDVIAITGSLYTQIFGAISKGTIFVSASAGKVSTGNGRFVMFQGANTAGGTNRIAFVNNSNGTVEGFITTDGALQNSASLAATGNILIAYGFANNDARVCVNGVLTVADNAVIVPSNLNEFRIGADPSPNSAIKQICFWPDRLTDTELQYLTTPTAKMGRNGNQIPSNNDLGRGSFVSPEAILRTLGKQCFSADGTGASVTRNVRFPFNFTFEIIDNSGVTTMTTTPATDCLANTDNPLTFTAPTGKTLLYAITPIYEY